MGSPWLKVFAVLAMGGCGVATRPAAVPPTATPVAGAARLEPLALAPDTFFRDPAGERLALATSSGAPLRLARARITVRLEPPLAFTELRLELENPERRRVEARLALTLPERATLSTLEVQVGERFQAASVADQLSGRAAYEAAVEKAVDPALAERSGQRFELRLFPIDPYAKREIVLAYSEPVSDELGYRFPVAGLPPIEALEASVRDADGHTLSLPTSPQALAAQRVIWPRSAASARRSGNQTFLRVRPVATERREPLGTTLFLVDSSASRAAEFAEQAELARSVIERLDGAPTVLVARFDRTVEELFDGPRADAVRTVASKLLAARPLGDSDPCAALQYAERRARQRGLERVVIVSDGVVTVGAPTELARCAARLKDVGVRRIDAVIGGHRRDSSALEGVVSALPESGVVIDARLGPERIARKLGSAVERSLPIAVDGAGFVWPSMLATAQFDDEVFVAAELAPELPLKLRIGSRELEVPSSSGSAELVRHAVAAARVDQLLASGPRTSEELRRKVAELGIAEHLVTPATSFLLLEDEPAEGAFGVAREPVSPRPWPFRPEPEKPAPKDAEPEEPDATGPVRATSAPIVRMIDVKVEGELPAGVVERVLRAQFGALRLCYHRALERDPKASGRVELSLAVTMTGAVDQQKVSRSEFEPVFDECARTAFNRAPFPTPEKSPTSVTATFFLGARGQAIPASRAPLRLSRVVDVAGLAAPTPFTGRLGSIWHLLDRGDARGAVAAAERWTADEPVEPLAYYALGHVHQTLGQTESAARAYASLIDLYPLQTELRRFAGNLLESVGADGLRTALESYRFAAYERLDEPSGLRLLAYAYLLSAAPERAFEVLAQILEKHPPSEQTVFLRRVVADDLTLVAARWIAAKGDRATIVKKLGALGIDFAPRPSLRLILSWETPGDVDLHVFDRKGGHLDHQHPFLKGGGELLADVTTGYGPESATLPRSRDGYRVQVHYRSRGLLGFGMGTLHAIDHDGAGNVYVRSYPFLITDDGATVDLGVVGAMPATN